MTTRARKEARRGSTPSRTRKAAKPESPATARARTARETAALDRAILEQEIADSREALEAALRELDFFMHSVSHDLRVPLRHITGFAELLQTRLGEHPDLLVQRYVQTITDATARMGEMLDQLLTLSRVFSEPMRPVRLNLRRLVDEVVRELTPGVENRAIHWKITDLPAVTADRGLLHIALQNLLSNALKFSRGRDPAVIEISAHVAGSQQQIDVRDNGVGFDMAYAGKLFGVFQRLHAPTEFEGAGIGLASVRRIIARHGGKVWAEGVPDGGASFHFTLPVGRAS